MKHSNLILKKSVSLAMILFGLITQSGCPGTGKPAQTKCTQVGQQCKRGGGELGVCSPTSPSSNIASSKLECVAQH